jgi:hypothetical protein
VLSCDACGSGPADWLSAIGSVGALAVALLLLGRDIYDRHRAGEQSRRAQAAKVAVSKVWVRGESSMNADWYQLPAQIEITNRSEDVISDVHVSLWLEPPSGHSNGQDRHEWSLDLGRIDGGGSVEAGHTFDWPRIGLDPAPYLALSTVEFTDAAGVRWRRDKDHRLREIRQARSS